MRQRGKERKEGEGVRKEAHSTRGKLIRSLKGNWEVVINGPEKVIGNRS